MRSMRRTFHFVSERSLRAAAIFASRRNLIPAQFVINRVQHCIPKHHWLGYGHLVRIPLNRPWRPAKLPGCRLRPSLRTVVLLCELKDFSTEETADLLGISVSAVKARLFQARLKLRKTLGGGSQSGTRTAAVRFRRTALKPHSRDGRATQLSVCVFSATIVATTTFVSFRGRERSCHASLTSPVSSLK